MRYLLGFLLLLLATSCARFSEAHYLAVRTGNAGNQLEPRQFYRFTVRGYSYFQKTEFQSGWYDGEAVEALFSEVVSEVTRRNSDAAKPKAMTANAAPTVAKPSAATANAGAEEGSATARAGNHNSSAGAKDPTRDRRFVVEGPQGVRSDVRGKRFVIFAASNPKAIADEVAAFAENQDLANAVDSLIHRDQRGAVRERARELDGRRRRQAADLAAVKRLSNGIDDMDRATLAAELSVFTRVTAESDR